MKVRRLILGAALALTLTPFAGAEAASAACTAPTTGYPGAVTSTNGLVAYYRLGETSGTTACDAKGTSNGTYLGGYTLGQTGAIAGDTDKAAAFNGSTGYVSAPEASALDVGDTFTVEGWVKRATPGSGNWETIASKQSGAWLLMFNEFDQLTLRRSKYGNVVSSTATVSDTNWHYVAATKSGTSVHLYVDGKESTGTIANRTMTDNTEALVIGQSSSSSFYGGSVDELAVYRVALTASQIADHYSAGASAPAPAPAPAPTPAPSTSGDPVIAAAGDIACDPADPNFNGGAGNASGCHQRATSKLVVNTGLNGILTLGDEQYDDGTLAKFQQVYAGTWGQANNLGHDGVGNHEYLTSGAKGYWDYFNGVGIANGPAGPRGKGWYSFDVGTWHIVALNSNCSNVGCGSGSAQETWLRSDLSAHPNKCTLAFWHHPRFSSGIAGPTSAMSTMFTDLYNSGADVVLSGHDHDYERFAPQTPAAVADSSRGITEFVVGTGGKSLKSFNGAAKNSVVRHTGTYGVLRMTLHPSSYDFKFVPEAGQTWTDSGTVNCH
jgi:acid phosphatase type 7